MQAPFRGPVDPLKFSLKCHLANHLNAGSNEKDLITALAETLAETAHLFLGREGAADLVKHLVEVIENRSQTRRSEPWGCPGICQDDGREETPLGEASGSQNDA